MGLTCPITSAGPDQDHRHRDHILAAGTDLVVVDSEAVLVAEPLTARRGVTPVTGWGTSPGTAPSLEETSDRDPGPGGGLALGGGPRRERGPGRGGGEGRGAHQVPQAAPTRAAAEAGPDQNLRLRMKRKTTRRNVTALRKKLK